GPTPWGDEFGESSAKGEKDLRGDPLVLAHNEWRVTTRPGKLYFTFFHEPRVPFALPPMKNKVVGAYQLADGNHVMLKQENGKTMIEMPRSMWDPMATTIVVQIEGNAVEK